MARGLADGFVGRGTKSRLNLPVGAGAISLAAAAAIWLGALAGGTGRWQAVLIAVAVAAGLASRRHRAVAAVVLVAAGAVSGFSATQRIDTVMELAVPQGPGTLVGSAIADPWPFGDRYRFVLRPTAWQPEAGEVTPWRGPPVAVVAETNDVVTGDTVEVHGLLRALPDMVRGDPVAGRISAETARVVQGSSAPLLVAGNYLRRLVQSRLATLGDSPEAGLLAGFLIGDTAGLPVSDYEALRRSGLSHYVAVSGSNVALVLGAWWLAIGPLGAGTRMRAVTGLVVLSVFVVVTRWEPSVIRAATMAGMVLGGRALGIPVDAWTGLGAAVSVLLVVSGELAYDVGFQLSAAATAGVLLGLHWWRDRSPKVVWSALSATVFAQMAVTPLLLVHFGSVPVLSPVANVLAAPLVSAATSLAGAGVATGASPLLGVGARLAGLVLSLARLAGDWPQAGVAGVVVIAGLSAMALVGWLRPFVGVVVLVFIVATVIPPGPPDVATVVFVDVGQGDAVLLRDPSGAVALIDAGRDRATLESGLRRYGVTHIDLAVATHGDADHVGGFEGLSTSVGRLWIPKDQPRSKLLEAVVADMADRGTEIGPVGAGDWARLGEFDIEVIGPQRRYAAENDGSVVLLVRGGGLSVVLAGDAGATAQVEMPPLHPDVLLVPHHGAATTDLGWLAGTVGPVAVISVGENTYGHPDPAVVETLRDAGATILITDELGDISLPVGRR